MDNKHFDHLIGTQKDETTSQDKKLTKNIIDAYVKELPKEEIEENQRIGIQLEMESYLAEGSKETIEAGEFLNRLCSVYDIKKSKFAELIGIENANLHALLKGRRKFNSKIATVVGESFGINSELWLYIEAKNDLKKFNAKTKSIRTKIDLAAIRRG
jgi:plasmid maintenance system antidote protein VapI